MRSRLHLRCQSTKIEQTTCRDLLQERVIPIRVGLVQNPIVAVQCTRLRVQRVWLSRKHIIIPRLIKEELANMQQTPPMRDQRPKKSTFNLVYEQTLLLTHYPQPRS